MNNVGVMCRNIREHILRTSFLIDSFTESYKTIIKFAETAISIILCFRLMQYLKEESNKNGYKIYKLCKLRKVISNKYHYVRTTQVGRFAKRTRCLIYFYFLYMNSNSRCIIYCHFVVQYLTASWRLTRFHFFF